MKNKFCTILFFLILLIIFGCAEDKNMDDFRREQLQQSLLRINAISGLYTGPVTSKLDGSTLGNLTLKFQARTDVQTTGTRASSEQNAIVNGSINFKGYTTTEMVFDNGYYDDVTGDFQVTIPVIDDSGQISKLSLIGVIANDQWIGSIEVKGRPDFGGELNLLKNGRVSEIQSKDVSGLRIFQMKQDQLSYNGNYKIDGTDYPLKMSFINREVLPEQLFYKLFSPVRKVNVNCDFTDFELNFSGAILDDKLGTLMGRDPFDQRGTPVRANLSCNKFRIDSNDFGWDCEILTKVKLITVRLKANL